jgi:hypothetical protein
MNSDFNQSTSNTVDYLTGNGLPNEIQFSNDPEVLDSQAWKEYWESGITLPFLQQYSPYYNVSLRLSREDAIIEFRRRIANAFGWEKANSMKIE